MKSKKLTINKLVQAAHETAKDKGWWDSPREDGTLLMLMVGELSEAMEEARKGTPSIYHHTAFGEMHPADITANIYRNEVPHGQLIELADVVLRIADYCGAKGWDLEEALQIKMAYNKKRSYKHGGKKF